ncbi:hypothetical protein [Alkalihalobacillus sp. 1P02AB]|uniref:hypothetical protein n=1 Tax=Alkalihalobacillus sp. 1P02AB TaxID=3132260 RepID=UPI0039A6B27C
MFERVFLVVLVYIILFSFDLSRFSTQEKRAKFIYSVIILASLYQSIDFIWDAKWPNVVDFINMLFWEPAEKIVDYLSS